MSGPKDGAHEREERRPTFASAFPRTPELDALVRAFEDGDYARVRAEAPKLAASSDDAEVRAAARLLRARVDPDPLGRGLVVLTLLLLVFLTAYWTLHEVPPPPERSPPVENDRGPSPPR